MGVNRIGKYCYVGDEHEGNDGVKWGECEDGKIRDIGVYCLQMIYLGHTKYLI